RVRLKENFLKGLNVRKIQLNSWISSPDHTAGSSSSSHCGVDVIGPHGGPGPCSPHSASKQSDPMDLLSYQHINRVLREAHFQSLQSRAQSKHR
uniref:Uncharacterized protein n=1 Tax=Cyprinus carpio TaxID=7962 RepID=A0A8C1K8D8_CYPCA